jgi:hypothetical protein
MTDMAGVDHTNPSTGETFTETFQRGVVVIADGGRRDAGPEGGETGSRAADPPDEDTMEDVEHESPTEGANRSFERGTEGRTETV